MQNFEKIQVEINTLLFVTIMVGGAGEGTEKKKGEPFNFTQFYQEVLILRSKCTLR